MRCQRLFKSWVKALEHTPGMIIARDIHSGQVWRSREVVEAFGLDSHFTTWRDALAYTAPEDVARIENAHSKALKLGGVHYFTARGKTTPTMQEWFACACKAIHCEQCPNRCSIILYSAEVSSVSAILPEAPQ